MLLRTDLQVALSEVIEACLQAAHTHEEGAALVHDDRIAEALSILADGRRQRASELARQLQELGELPSEPNEDFETVRQIVHRVQVALAPDERETILAQSEQAEATLATAIQKALELQPPPLAKERLEGTLMDRQILDRLAKPPA